MLTVKKATVNSNNFVHLTFLKLAKIPAMMGLGQFAQAEVWI